MGLLFCMGRATSGGLSLVKGGLFRAWIVQIIDGKGLIKISLHKELVDTSWQFCPESQKWCHIMLHNCQTQNNRLFTLWSAMARMTASSSRAMPVITTMNHSSRTTGWPPWPPSALSPPPPPPPPGGVRLGESGGNYYMLHIVIRLKMA